MRTNAQPPLEPERIKDDDKRFSEVRELHPDWYVANTGASWKLHRAECRRQAPTNGTLWTSNVKVCGADRAGLETWVRVHLDHELTECAFCLGSEAH